MMQRLISLLTDGKGHSLVIRTASGEILCFDGRGVSDLYRLLEESPEKLKGAMAADRVTGIGAAALMAIGGVERYYTRVISRDALRLLQENAVPGEQEVVTEQIINRAGTGRCPLETLLDGVPTLEGMLVRIREFMADQNKK